MTPEQRLFFDTHGYLVVEDALSPSETAAALAALERVEEADRPRWQAAIAAGRASPVAHDLERIIEHGDIFLDLMEHRTTFPLMRDIVGDDIQLSDNQGLIKPARTKTHATWHSDIGGTRGVFHPLSVIMAKQFFFLTDVAENGGPLTFVPGSHRLPGNYPVPQWQDTLAELPGMVKMTVKAGTAVLFHCHLYHAAMNNDSDQPRKSLIYTYNHIWMKPWEGFAPTKALQDAATTPQRKQLLGVGDPYNTALPSN
jgi:ectoine hydroxylase-related dioxygenase (phytanoyl-CoA dioxygenase family)